MATLAIDLGRVTLAPLTVRFREDEAANCLLRRLAVRRGCETVQDFLKTIPHCPAVLARTVPTGQHLDVVARLSGFALEAIAASTPVRTARGYMLGEVLLESGGKLGVGPGSTGKVCPVCLLEDRESLDGPAECRPYRRFWWDLDGIDGCPSHNLPLLTRCPDCGVSSHVVNMRPDRCRCGLDLAGSAEETTAGYDADVLRMIRGGPSPWWAHGVSIRSVTSLALRVGILEAKGSKVAEVRRLETRQRMAMTALGASLLDSGWNEIDALFDRRAAAGRRRNAGEIYGDLLKWLDRVDEEGLTPLKERMAEHAANVLREVHGRFMFGLELDKLARSRHSAGSPEPGSSVFLDALNRARPHAEHGRSEDLAAVLGITRGQIDSMMFKDPVDRLEGAVRHRHNTYRYDTAGALAFLEAAATAPVFAEIPTLLVPLLEVRRLRRSWVAVYRALREGRMSVAGLREGQSGLAAILVSRDDVRAACPVERPGWEESSLSNPEARKRLGVTSGTLQALRRRGFVRYVRRRSADDKSSNAPSLESVAAFERDYVTLKGLGCEFGASDLELVQSLEDAGIRTVLDDGDQDLIFLRAEAMAALSSGRFTSV
jgi:hypothetical protein